MSSSDRIEKEVLLRAPRSRVWEAVGDSREFGKWFNAVLEGPFEPGKTLHGTITEPGWEGTRFVVFVERVEPGRHLSFRWHPYPAGPEAVGDSATPTTLVSFDLDDAPDGTRLRIVESGFDAIPFDRRADARKSNDEGWTIQAERIAKHVAKAA
jgi:uncharacterized protein YndB with AHSA1/START domain